MVTMPRLSVSGIEPPASPSDKQAASLCRLFYKCGALLSKRFSGFRAESRAYRHRSGVCEPWGF